MKEIKKTNIFILLVFIIYPLINVLLAFLKMFKVINLSFVENIITSQIFLILIPSIIFYLLAGKGNPSNHLKFKKLTGAKVGLLFLIPLCVFPITGLIRLITSLFVAPSSISTELSNPALDLPYLALLLLVAVLPALIEEFLVRGILFSNYREINIRTGILLSSFLFGMLHFNFDQFFYATFLGFVLAAAYEFTENLIAPMMIHFIINGTSVTLAHLSKSYLKYAEKVNQQSQELVDSTALSEAMVALQPTITILLYIILLIVFLGFSILGLWALRKIFKYFAVQSNKLDTYRSLFQKPSIKMNSLLKHWPITLCVVIFLGISILLEVLVRL